MDVKEAVGLAKKYIREVFADERIADLGLEEVEYDDKDVWSVTVGFSREWNSKAGGLAPTFFPLHRDYKVVRISDTDKRMISVKNREPIA
jgi:hypothetical protein